jgi:hypothetical protein
MDACAKRSVLPPSDDLSLLHDMHHTATPPMNESFFARGGYHVVLQVSETALALLKCAPPHTKAMG